MTVRWTYVSLRISSQTVDPDQVSTALRMQATHKLRIGDPITRHARAAIATEHTWLLDSPLAQEANVKEHLGCLIGLIEPYSETLRDLGVDLGFWCTLTSDQEQGGLGLSRQLVQSLAQLNAGIEITLLPVSAGEGQSVESEGNT